MSSSHAPEPGADARLMSAIARGDVSALAQLYDHHAPSMMGVAFRILQNRQDAEDLLHDVFVEAWRKARDYDPSRGSVRSWLLMRVRSRGIDRVRTLDAARRHALAQVASAAPDPARAQVGWDAPDRARACAALSLLPEEQRVLVELSYFEGMTCTEMATHCGIPVGTVKSRLAAAMGKLRQRLGSAEIAR